MAQANNELLTDLLKDVSRSFYLTLRVLPMAIRPQIGLAYLLARTTDTIADTEIIPVEQRLKSLQALRDRILGHTTAALEFGELSRHQASASEGLLLQRIEESISLLQTMSAADQKLIREVLDVITSGQELDLKRFAGVRPPEGGTPNVIALQNDAELDDYTYRVAGCVGEFWTKMCRAHLFPQATLDDAQLLSDGIRFGKGLQLVNILRDMPRDLQQGRCYLPKDGVSSVGLTPEDLLKAENEPKLRPLYNIWLNRAEAHLKAGWLYTNTIPRGQMRVRLACAWPILIGLKTIGRLRTGNVLNLQQRIKISRGEVYGVMFQTVVRYPFASAWQRLV